MFVISRVTCITTRCVPYPPCGVRERWSTSLKKATQGTALTTDLLRSFRFSTSCLPSSSRIALHVLCACTTSSMHFALVRGTLNPLQNLLAVARQRTRANKATYACFSIPQNHMTQYPTLYYSTASFSVALWVQSLPYWRPCTRRHPAGCVLGRPVSCLYGATWGFATVPTVPAAVCNLHRPCIAGHAELVAPRHAVGWTSNLTTKVSGPGLRG